MQYLAKFGDPVPTERDCSDCVNGTRYEIVDYGDEGSSYECGTCDGTGRIMKPDEEILEEYARTLYNRFVNEDYDKLQIFLNQQGPKYV